MSKKSNKTKKLRIYPPLQTALDKYRAKFAVPPAETATLNQAGIIGLKELSK